MDACRNVATTAPAPPVSHRAGHGGVARRLNISAGIPLDGSCQATHFEAVVGPCIPALHRRALRLCGDREAAADITQDTLTRAWRHLHQLRDDKAAIGWLMMILRREYARTWERRAFTYLEIDLDELPDAAGDATMDPRDVHRALDALPEKYRDPLVRYYIEGYNVNEIAQSMGTNPSTVSTLMFRARKQMRAHLTGAAGSG